MHISQNKSSQTYTAKLLIRLVQGKIQMFFHTSISHLCIFMNSRIFLNVDLRQNHNLIMLTKALSRQRRLFPLFNHYQTLLLSPFCTQASRMWSQTAQKAVFASAIIKLILNAKHPLSFTDQSLREKIIALQISDLNFTMDRQYRRQVLQMFTTGINLSQTVFKQTRVIQARQVKTETKMIFCPNYLVTRQIFQQFVRKHKVQGQTSLLITGNYGIAKTISIILLIQLSNYIQKLIYQAKNNPTKQDELKELKKLQLLLENIPKVLYWNIDLDSLQRELFSLILEQFPQLSKQHKSELQQKKDYKKFVQSLKNIYPQTVYKVLVIDQINSLVAQVRVWNTKFQQYRQKIQKLGSKQQMQIQKLTQQMQNEWQRMGTNKIQLALDNISSLRLLANRLFLNSSANIELDILQKDKDGGKLQKKGLSLHHSHKKVQIEILDYQNLLKNQLWAKMDFWSCFWFELTRRFIQKEQVLTRLKSLKPKIIERFLSNSKEKNSFKFQIKPFYRFLYIRQYFDKSTLINQINYDQSDEQLLQTIEILLKDFEGECIVLCGDHLLKFLEKNKTKEKTSAFLHFYNLAKQQYEKGQKQTFSMTIGSFQKYLSLKKDFSEQGSKMKAQLMNREFLTYSIKQKQRKVFFTISPLSFMQISNYILFPRLIEYFPLGTYLDINNSSLMGFILESYFLDCIKKETQVQFFFAAYGVAKGQTRLAKNSLWEKIFKFSQGTYEFISLKNNKENPNKNKGKKVNKEEKAETEETEEKKESEENADNEVKATKENKSTFSKSFKDLFQVCKNSPNNFFAALPSTQKTARLTRDYQSPSIDFAFAVYQKQEKTDKKESKQQKQKYKYKLYTFDITVTGLKSHKAPTNVYTKQNKSYDLLVQNKEVNDDVQVIHTIIAGGVPKSIRTQIHKPHNWLTITYASWKDINFINVEDSISKGKFDEARKLLNKQVSNSPNKGEVEN